MAKLPAQDIVERLRDHAPKRICIEVDGYDPGPQFHTHWVLPGKNTERQVEYIRADFIEAQAADTISRLTADNEALRKDNARLSEEKDALAFGMRHGQSLSEDAIHAIRELLNKAGVPLAAFIDDHVGNAIVQRNQERARADALAQEVEETREHAKRLEHAVAFTAKMAWRTDPPNANNKLTDAERLSAIKHHPTIKLYGEPDRELAAKEAASRPLPLQETEGD